MLHGRRNSRTPPESAYRALWTMLYTVRARRQYLYGTVRGERRGFCWYVVLILRTADSGKPDAATHAAWRTARRRRGAPRAVGKVQHAAVDLPWALETCRYVSIPVRAQTILIWAASTNTMRAARRAVRTRREKRNIRTAPGCCSAPRSTPHRGGNAIAAAGILERAIALLPWAAPLSGRTGIT